MGLRKGVNFDGKWRGLSALACVVITSLLALTTAVRSDCQSVDNLAQVKKVYVERFDEGEEAEPLRMSLIKRLTKSGRYQVVDTAQTADAIVKGSGEIWLKGYLTVNSRTPSKDRQAVYGGYLSVELTSREGEPLWSYLVTPSKLTFLKVRDDLANNLVKEMSRASELAQGQPSSIASAAALNLSPTELTGGGATFPAPLYRRWFASFKRLHPEIQIRYEEIGSEAGVEAIKAKTVDFAASDLPASADGMEDGKVRRIASVLGGVVPVYHLEGVNHDLRFTPEVLAGIFMGRIRRWNDPELQKLNKDADLPNTEIDVVHRSDGSGTTYAWSDFLARTNADWKTQLGVGTKVKWPVGVGVEGNENLATAVLQKPNSLGYVELVYAIQHHLSFGSVRNRSGEFVHADLDSLAEAARSFAGAGVSILDAPGKNAYPIATFTWLLVPSDEPDAAKQAAMNSLLEWILVEGQRECSSLGYAPLPREVAEGQMSELNSKK